MAFLFDGLQYQFQSVLDDGISARPAQSVEHQTLNLRVVGSSPMLGDDFAMKLGKLFSAAG